ncbi:uncharacterized protein [Ptychodera flava]|uniref:uncharacterized protein n=1 Tax=Ptychodera flava TaxID=63121 RepID=UPI00396A28A3
MEDENALKLKEDKSGTISGEAGDDQEDAEDLSKSNQKRTRNVPPMLSELRLKPAGAPPMTSSQFSILPYSPHLQVATAGHPAYMSLFRHPLHVPGPLNLQFHQGILSPVALQPGWSYSGNQSPSLPLPPASNTLQISSIDSLRMRAKQHAATYGLPFNGAES